MLLLVALWLHSTAGLSLLHIHQDKSVDAEAVLQKFGRSGHRRIALAFPRDQQQQYLLVTKSFKWHDESFAL